MKHIGFNEIKMIQGLKMNGGETTGNFVTYECKEQKIDVKFLETLFSDFFEPLGCHMEHFQGIIDAWRNTSTITIETSNGQKRNHDREVKSIKQYPTITGPSPVISIGSNKIGELLEYLDQEGNTDNFSTRGLCRTATKTIATLQKSCDGGGYHMCG
jgi:hypothetical protein